MSVELAEAFVRIRPDTSGFAAELRADMAAELAGVDGKVPIDGDSAAFMSKLVSAQAAARAARPSVTVDANTGPAVAGVATAVRVIDASNATVTVGANVAPALASIEALKAAMKLSLLPTFVLAAAAAQQGITPASNAKSDLVPAIVGAGAGGGNNGSILTALLAGGAAGGKGGGGGGLLSSLLWGGGGIAGMAGIGSLASFAGLGAEHLLTTGLGLAGSAAGGAIGGGLLGLGTLGVGAVGMGTDLAGIGQAAGDIKNVVSAQNALNQAIAVYGPLSTQAAAAQGQLNFTLGSFSQVARSSVLQAANTAQQFHQMFNQATGPAEAIGAQIINQGMLVGEKFLASIGAYATENLGIIKAGLQPLFSWISTTGLGIFDELEAKFHGELPSAMGALVNGVELFIKTIGVASTYTGGFIVKLDAFLTRMNTTGFQGWSVTIGKLIADFRLWWGLIKAVGDVIYNLFTHDAGTASSIVMWLTQMLDKLAAWEKSTSGASSLHNIFEVHKQEILDILNLLPALLKSFGSIYMTVAPAMVTAVTTVLSALAPLLNDLAKNPFGAWMLGLLLIGGKLGLLGTVLAPLGKIAWGPIADGIKAIGISTGILDAAGGANLMSYAKAFGVLAAGAAAFYGTTKLLDTIYGKPKSVSPSTNLTPQALSGISAYNASITARGLPPNVAGPPAPAPTKEPPGFIGPVWTPPQPIVLPAPDTSKWDIGWHNWLSNEKTFWGNFRAYWDTVWQNVDTDARHWWGDVESFFVGWGQRIYGDATRTATNIYSFLDGTWQRVDRDVRTSFGDVISFFTALPTRIAAALSKLGGLLQRVAADAWHLFQGGTETAVNAVLAFVGAIPANIMSGLKTLGGFLQTVATEAWRLFSTATTTIVSAVLAFVEVIPTRVLGFLNRMVGDLSSLASRAWHAFYTAMVTAALAVWTFVSGIPSKILGYLTGLPGLLTSDGRLLIDGFWGAIVDTASLVWGFFSNLPGAIKSFFGGAGSWLYGVGAAIVQGLLDGIESLAGAVSNAVQGIVNKVKSIPVVGKLIGSPSPYFIEVGHAMMQGWALGITGGSPLVTAASSRVVGLVKGPLDSAAAFAAAGAASAKGAQSVTLTLNDQRTVQVGDVASMSQVLAALDADRAATIAAIGQLVPA